MKALISLAAIALLGLSVSGCQNLQNVASVSAKVAAATPTVVMDLELAGALTGQIAAQIAAANPSNVKIQTAVAKINAGTALTTSDAVALAPALQLVNGSIQVVAATAFVK